MRKKIGCLHAHYSNIAYIQQALATYELELVHYVDPGLISRITNDSSFNAEKATSKVTEQLRWIMGNQVDAILLTCTNYIALLDEEQLQPTVPIIKIDEPFFAQLAAINQPHVLLFTNPATVEGTIERLMAHTDKQGVSLLHLESHVIEDTFDLLMQGKQEAYEKVICSYIEQLHEDQPDIQISVAQLSMVNAASRMEQELGMNIGNPLKPLVKHILDALA
ncbi:hypothetical protein [Paenibacillus roseipurpureus]|uniref:Asp/Glu racemase n=1 Tax=Paenibacillus roseopurpureus TaxID=2918901 RepID=A0AA96LJB4_9BACL|nr:hypothetical protein [Paenibacillus sp. MBLB1832]WNR42076.1 hypothetical protein MJB10_13110 [Paenibacillus sp. MBLB1832]